MSANAAYPSGHVTLVFTDIESSTRMNSALGNAIYEAQMRKPHNDRVSAAIGRHNGHTVKTNGDSFMIAFQNVDDALAGVVDIQQTISQPAITATDESGKSWEVRVRIGVHTAEQQLHPDATNDYYGGDVNFAARVEALGAGGQIIISANTYKVAGSRQLYRWQEWPNRYLKSFDDGPQAVWELLYAPGQAPREPGSRFFPTFYQGERNVYIERPAKQDEVLRHFAERRSDGTTARLVTLKAEGGMGKTRLAIACAVRLVGAFAHGAHFVSLARDRQPDEVPDEKALLAETAEAVGQALGLKGEAALPDNVFQALETRDTLLVLDNYESVACPAVGRFVARLVTETPKVCVLVTGRQEANVAGMEKLVYLDGGMSESQARDLFVARAALRWNPSRVPPANEDKHLTRILRLTSVDPDTGRGGSIPLALELAAAWAGRRTLQQIADGLESTPLGEMAALPRNTVLPGDDSTSERQQSLHRSLTWSYNLLGHTAGATAQQVFAATSIFADTFDDATVTAIMDMPKAQTALDSLVDASLIRFDDNTARYRLHRFTRHYAALRLSEVSVAAAIRQRFVSHYVEVVQKNQNLNDLACHAVLDNEWRNVAAAADLAASLTDHTAVRDISFIGNFLTLRGFWAEAERLYCAGVTAARAKGERISEGTVLVGLGNVYGSQDRWTEAIAAYKSGLDVFREFHDRTREGNTHMGLGNVYHRQGSWDEAISAYEDSLAISRECHDRIGEGRTLIGLGNVYGSQDRWTEAIAAYKSSLDVFREFHDLIPEGTTLNNLGNIYWRQGNWDEAITAYEASLVISREFGDRIGEGRTLINLAILWATRQDTSQALPFARQAVAVLKDTHDVAELAKSREILAKLEQR